MHPIAPLSLLFLLLALLPVQAQTLPTPAPTASAPSEPPPADAPSPESPDAEEDWEVETPTDSPSPEPSGLPRIGGRNISAFTRNLLGNTTVGGYFDSEYYFPADRAAFFDQHRLILQVSSLLHERLFFNTEIEFEHGAIIGFGANDGELKIEQATLDYKIDDWAILRTGVVLIPVGRLNILHDSDFRDTTVRPLFTHVIVPSTWMETGAGFYGTLFPDDYWEINYETYIVQGLTDNLADGNGLRGARGSLSSDNNGGKALTGRVGFSPFIGLDFGLGGYFSAIDPAEKKNLGMVIGDFSWSTGPWEFLGEGGFVAFDPTTQVLADGSSAPLLGPMWGYYLEGHYHLFPEFLADTFLANGFEQPVITLFGRVSQVDTDASQLNQNDRLHLTLGLNYRPTTNTVFKLEYQWNLESEALIRNDPSKEIANNQLVLSVAAGF
ncbi:MAG: hypothetical protein ACO1RX_12975 [Candidatus Sericytochromatia bacterium]